MASRPHISPDELAEAREIATTWTMDAPAIRMAVMVLDLFEQFESACADAGRLQLALDDAIDVAIWLSALVGNPDGANDPAAAETWQNVMRPKLFGAMASSPASDPDAKLWESTLMDGLEDDPYPASSPLRAQDAGMAQSPSKEGAR